MGRAPADSLLPAPGPQQEAPMVKQWQGGLTGPQHEAEDADLKNLKRVDETWPRDSMGNKVSLPPTIASTINSLPDETD